MQERPRVVVTRLSVDRHRATKAAVLYRCETRLPTARKKLALGSCPCWYQDAPRTRCCGLTRVLYSSPRRTWHTLAHLARAAAPRLSIPVAQRLPWSFAGTSTVTIIASHLKITTRGGTISGTLRWLRVDLEGMGGGGATAVRHRLTAFD